MRLKLTSTDTESASASGMISRRSFMGATAAIATVPAVAVAETLAKSDRLPQSLESQLDDCVAQLRDILHQMFPAINAAPRNYLQRCEDGSFRFELRGDIDFIPFQGEGVYLVSRSGMVFKYMVREEPVVTLTGVHLGCFHYYGRQWNEDTGDWDDEERIVSSQFLRKLEGGGA